MIDVRAALLLLLCTLTLTPGFAAAPVAVQLLSAPRAVVELSESGQGPPPLDSALWQRVALPDVAQRKVDSSTAEMPLGHTMNWYQLEGAALALPTDRPLAIYVPRVVGQPAQLWQWSKAGWVKRFDNEAGEREQWNRPLLIELPQEQDASLGPTLALGVPSREGQFHALSTVWMGPLTALRERAEVRNLLQLTVPAAASLAMVAMVAMGLLSLAVWVRRRPEKAYLYFALAAVIWPLRNAHHFINLPREEPLYSWFWWMTDISIAWLMLVIFMFAFRFDARRLPRVEHGLAIFVILGSVLTMPIFGVVPLLFQHVVNLLAALVISAILSVLALRGGSRELRVIVLALWLSMALSVHDWLLLALRITPESVYLLPYGSMLVIGSFLYASLRRFIGAVEQAESASRVLAARLAERERELQIKHDALRRAEKEQALLVERQRLMSDMHDGVGSTLIAMLRVVESQAFSRESVADLLRLAIEDLRLTIDSLEPIEHDLATLLATLRTRVGRRLEGAGLHLRWEMDDMPPLPWLEPAQALQVLRLVQEAMSNVIKHAQARTLSISAGLDADSLLVCVADDGQGFDPTLPSPGNGLISMRQRARKLGVTLDINAAPGRGTVVSIRLPLNQHLPNQLLSPPIRSTT